MIFTLFYKNFILCKKHMIQTYISNQKILVLQRNEISTLLNKAHEKLAQKDCGGGKGVIFKVSWSLVPLVYRLF